MHAHLDITTALGTLRLIAEDDRLHRIAFTTARVPNAPIGPAINLPILCETACQIKAWLLGDCIDFGLPLAPYGTPFQRAVRAALVDIPYGQTRSYGAVAQQIGSPGAARAVGLACRNNPLPIVVPCHRVLAADGRLVGYNGGLAIKRHLLALEARVMKASTR